MIKKFFTKNEIIFRAKSEHVFEVREKPIPANKIIPNWWKSILPYTNKEQKLDLSPAPTVTVKRCISAYDALSSGYVVTLWADILVKYDEEIGHSISWACEENVFGIWNKDQVSGYEIPDGYGDGVFKYIHGWQIKTPKDWSSLIVHPFGYPNLPFKVIPGIVDTDLLKTDINTPIVFKKGFEGIIEKGTPIFQIIPIKRESWTSSHELQKENEHYLNQEKLSTKIISSYARNLRSPKNYR